MTLLRDILNFSLISTLKNLKKYARLQKWEFWRTSILIIFSVAISES